MSAQVISFHCILKNRAGTLIGTTFNREVLTSIENPQSILSGLAKGMQNLIKGEKRIIALKAEEAYGLYDPTKVILFPRKKLPRDLQMGQTITIVGKSGIHRSYRVLQIHDDLVSLDENHPLAGQDLIFEIETVSVRSATAEEIAESANLFAVQTLH